MYYIITGDLVGSRKIQKRAKVQDILKQAIQTINKQFQQRLLCPFVIGWGDSFQGALKSLEGLYEVIEAFESHLSIPFRCGIGIGEISTDFSINTLEMDGSAFHFSQSALQHAKKEDKFIWIKSVDQQFDNLVNTIWTLLYTIKSGWTDRQREIIQLRQKNLTYKEIGNRKKISKQAVHNILKSANWEVVSMAISTLNNLKFQRSVDNGGK
ncbi:MAG: SatD family protein [Candidatus Hodarchaeales archaeon]